MLNAALAAHLPGERPEQKGSLVADDRLRFDYAAAAQLIRHGENGMLAPCDDRDAFVAASVAVAGDPERRRRFGEQARLASASIGWDSVVARFEQVLSTVAGGGEIDAAPARFARGVPIA
jgi:hypothetical protein